MPDTKQRWGRGNVGGKLHKGCFMEVLGFQEENKAKSPCRQVSLAAESFLARVASLQLRLVQLWRSNGPCSSSKGWLSVAATLQNGLELLWLIVCFLGRARVNIQSLLQGSPCCIALGFTLLLPLECGAGEILWPMECSSLRSTGKISPPKDLPQRGVIIILPF